MSCLHYADLGERIGCQAGCPEQLIPQPTADRKTAATPGPEGETDSIRLMYILSSPFVVSFI